jgi:hypothetical protein
MSSIFLVRLLFGLMLVCFVMWMFLTGNPLLLKDFGATSLLAIALQFFLLGHQYHQERTEKNADS